jgi:hypothetical protein
MNGNAFGAMKFRTSGLVTGFERPLSIRSDRQKPELECAGGVTTGACAPGVTNDFEFLT